MMNLDQILDEIKTLDELIQTTEYTHNTTKELKQAIINTIQSLVLILLLLMKHL